MHGLALALIHAVLLPGASEPAYQEQVVTPHWAWVDRHAAGTLKVLFLLNERAMREADEVAQRCDLKATVLAIRGNYENRTYDVRQWEQCLAQPWDLIVLASDMGPRALKPEHAAGLWRKVHEGTPLALFLQGPRAEKELSGLLDGGPPSDVTAEAVRAMPIREIVVRTPLRLSLYRHGQGRVVTIPGFDMHWTFFSAFVPPMRLCADRPMVPELHYALVGRMLRWIAGREGPIRTTAVAAPDGPATLGAKHRFRVALSPLDKSGNPIVAGDQIPWTLHSPYGEPIARGEVTLAAGQHEAVCDCTVPRTGLLVWRWQLRRQDRTLDFGALCLQADGPARLANLAVPEVVPRQATLEVGWTIDGAASGKEEVTAEVYDPDHRLVSRQRAKAALGKLVLPAWPPLAVCHQVRIMLRRENLVLDERRVDVQVPADRADDAREFQVIVWGSETGSPADRPRYRRLRQLGITAVATMGRNELTARMAAEEGLRIVPTNIFVPANRFKPKFDPERETQELETFARQVAKYSPLGYSLADEPSKVDVAAFRNQAAEIIRRHDHQARVGFCGVWEGFDRDPPSFFAACDFSEPYSPFHLYTPNLWLGNERDLYRSFSRPGSITTCWTHYAPWLDHEPYSRTVPWLWLFEGLNGVSYFDSGGEFAVLPGDLRTTHETRWWSDEVHDLQRGLGRQLVAARREAGQIRIVFSPGALGADLWARALNETQMPYRFASRQELVAGLDKTVKLLICPNLVDLSDAEAAALERFAAEGGLLLATGPCGVFTGDRPAPSDRIPRLFGMDRTSPPADRADLAKRLAVYGNIPVKVAWQAGADGPSPSADISGKTIGERGLVPAGAQVLGSFQEIGEVKRADASPPDFVKELFATPAAVVHRCGQGTAMYLTFQPDVATIKSLLPGMSRRAGVTSSTVQVVSRRTPATSDTIYVYPLQDGPIRLVGVVEDYWRVPANRQVEGGLETSLYYHHGPQLWDAADAELIAPSPTFIYDVRRGKCLGRSDRTTFALQPGRPELFALLPYRPTRIRLTVPDRAMAGAVLEAAVALEAEGATPGGHVVQVTLTDPAGRQTPADRRLVTLAAGRGKLSLQIPFNAAPGAWRIVARDGVTGLSCEASLSVERPAETHPGLLSQDVSVHRTALDWPTGKLIAPAPVIDSSEVKVEIAPLKTVKKREATDHADHRYLVAGITLANREVSYVLRYNVCNDAAAHGWTDPRQIWAPYPPGLGFQKPNPNSWYYNGYLEILLDDFVATHYAIREIKQVPSGASGRVEVTFDTPRGQLVLSFALMPDYRAIFQELAVRASAPIEKITLKFRTYYWGFGPPDGAFVHVDPEKKAWALMGDKIQDRAFGKGAGPCAILVLPERLDAVRYANPTILEKTVRLAAGGQARLHWALWTLPDLSNARALDYLRDTAPDARRRLIRFYNAEAAPE